MRIQTILHPTDFSPQSRHAFDLACSLARDHGARLIVMHVVDQPGVVYGGMIIPPPPANKVAEDQVRQLCATVPNVPTETRVMDGDPATWILQIAKECNCDLIALGTQGRTGLSRLLMGSVAEKVMRGAPCPVLTVNTGNPDPDGKASSVG
jgi:nucleotide-binding universal stress UspA family protein